MDKNKENVPKIRFPGFTSPWEQRKVKDIFKVTRGYVLAATETMDKKTDEMPYPVYSSQTKDNGLMGYYKDFLYENAITWTTDGANAGTVNYRDGKFYCTNVCGVLLSDDGYANKMVSEALNNISCKHVSKVGNPKLMNNVMSEIVVSLPKTIEEQNIISDLLNRLDNLITLHQRKLNHLQDKKKSLLQKMFPKNGECFPELRFPGFTDPWEQRNWEETADISTNMVDPKTGSYDELPHIGPGNIESFTGKILDNVMKVKDSNLISGKFHFYKGDIIYGKINPQLGKYAIAPFEGLASADSYILNTKNGVVQNFLYSVLQTNDFYKYSVSVSTRTGMPKINRDELNVYNYKAPKTEEQTRIGNLFVELDHLIVLHQRKLNHIKEQKKSLLQQMFI
ncbi:Type I restriction modification DNA specificity domain protein [Clostridium liquoris]|uniref:Type I restriction modification DNA specificity domain protein n=1 Tax=Clostridium liquoris TaxID=1289519 RepID=A0A2T0BA71_9CLOT|nr:restriction endonuclease subunit S [Clostridium liquoris]PRR80697.1 Type I restriction modification DNA specificity domain protein [Clostridium liquoris]